MKSYLAKVQIFIFRPKTMDYSPWFHFSESKKSFEKGMPSERAPQEDQNGANFSFVAPSSEELWAFKPFLIHCCDDLYHVRTFGTVGAHNSSLEGAMKLKFVSFYSY